MGEWLELLYCRQNNFTFIFRGSQDNIYTHNCLHGKKPSVPKNNKSLFWVRSPNGSKNQELIKSEENK